MLGYLDAGECRRQIDEAGWCEGHHQPRGREVSALDIENVLRRHPAVGDVAVKAVPDARYGEVGAAYLVQASDAPRPSAEQMVEFVRAEGMATNKTPRYFEWIDSLPTAPNGKVRKPDLPLPAGHEGWVGSR